MTSTRGYIVLMGSGELTSTMVEVHKDLINKLSNSPTAVFLDTPAGFQLNADQISQKAVKYFTTHIQHPLSIASFKSQETINSYEAEQAYTTLNSADYTLVGPGSPTYAVRQWQGTPIPSIIKRRIKAGGCFVAASAAALTVGALTLPVYEIYKVGSSVSWSPGMNILSHFGLDLVVIPHWNNAEGGTHDTRFCYMGEPRFRQLEKLVPEHISILGLDEHTACILDFENQDAKVRGLGSVCIHRQGMEIVFSSGETFPLDVLRNPSENLHKTKIIKKTIEPVSESKKEDKNFWNTIHSIESAYATGIENNNVNQLINAVLEFDKTLWIEQENAESAEFISQAREKFREMIVGLETILSSARKSDDRLKHLIGELLTLRTDFRKKNLWNEADKIRGLLEKSDIIVDDSAKGSIWRIKK